MSRIPPRVEATAQTSPGRVRAWKGAAPDSPSSTPGCASCARPASCTTGCGWSSHRSWSRTCTCRGSGARVVPRAAGGRRHGQQPARLAVGGGQRHRRRAVLPGVQPGAQGAKFDPRATTSGAGCPSSGISSTAPHMNPGRFRRVTSGGIPSASSSTTSNDGRLCIDLDGSGVGPARRSCMTWSTEVGRTVSFPHVASGKGRDRCLGRRGVEIFQESGEVSRGGADPMPQPAAGPGGLVLMTTADGDDRPQRTVVVQPIARCGVTTT